MVKESMYVLLICHPEIESKSRQCMLIVFEGHKI